MNNSRRKRQPDLIESFFLALGRALWFLISLPFRKYQNKRPKRLNQAVYQGHWQNIESLLNTNCQQAIIEADKLLDQAMRELGVSGETFADRLKSAEWRFDQNSYNALWSAHKLRNQIAHEVGHAVNETEARSALANFRRGLQSLGAF